MYIVKVRESAFYKLSAKQTFLNLKKTKTIYYYYIIHYKIMYFKKFNKSLKSVQGHFI